MHQRQQQLLEMMRHGMVEIKRAAASLGVAEMTVRRDLQALAEQRLVMMVKGGAVVHPSPVAITSRKPACLRACTASGVVCLIGSETASSPAAGANRHSER